MKTIKFLAGVLLFIVSLILLTLLMFWVFKDGKEAIGVVIVSYILGYFSYPIYKWFKNI